MPSNRHRRLLLSGDSAVDSDSHVPSFRVYNGVAFSWELQPGVAKVAPASADVDALPPLTPPPSYYCGDGAKDVAAGTTKKKKKTSRLKQLASMFLDLTLNRKKERRISPRSPTTSSAVSAASSSSPNDMPSMYYSGGWRCDDDDEDYLDDGSTASSASCLRVQRVPCMPFYYDRKIKLITRSKMK